MGRRVVLCLLFSLAFAPAAAQAGPPVLRTEVPAGGGSTVALPAAQDGARRVDANPSDWGGRLPGFGGAEMYSRGELVYEDHIFDAYGADNGQDAQRMAVQDPLEQAVPETYRIDPALQYVPQEFGIPPGPPRPGSTSRGGWAPRRARPPPTCTTAPCRTPAPPTCPRCGSAPTAR